MVKAVSLKEKESFNPNPTYPVTKNKEIGGQVNRAPICKLVKGKRKNKTKTRPGAGKERSWKKKMN